MNTTIQNPDLKPAIENLKQALERINSLKIKDHCEVGEEIYRTIPDIWSNDAARSIEFSCEISRPAYERKSQNLEGLLLKANNDFVMFLLNHIWQLGEAIDILKNPTNQDAKHISSTTRALQRTRDQLQSAVNSEVFGRINEFENDIKKLLKEVPEPRQAVQD